MIHKLQNIQSLKEIILDTMRHNQYLSGKIEIDFNTAKNRCAMSIHMFEQISENGHTKKIRTTIDL